MEATHLYNRTNYILSAQHCNHYTTADSIVELLIQIFHLHFQRLPADSLNIVDSVVEFHYIRSNNDSI